VLAVDPRIEVLVVDDNSPDGTGQIADRLAAENPRIQFAPRRQTGTRACLYCRLPLWHEKKYDFIFEMDADFSAPTKIPRRSSQEYSEL